MRRSARSFERVGVDGRHATARQFTLSNEVITIADVPTPAPRTGEVRTRVHATTVSGGDWRARSLSMPPGFGPFGWNTPEKRAALPPQATHDEMMRDLTWLLGRQEFKNFDDMNAFQQRKVTGKPLPRVLAATDRERAEVLVMPASHERSRPKLRRQVATVLTLDAVCLYLIPVRM